MSLAHAYDTVPAHPLGIPVDGRERYGMTAEQACVYRFLVKTFILHDMPFRVRFRATAKAMGTGTTKLHARVKALVERGWIIEKRRGVYAFVHPVMHFKVPR